MNKVFEGRSNIKVRILCDSVSSITGDRLTTFEVEYPRIIHSEFLTHRMFSRNAASSRAIPFAKMAENLKGIPARFGANVAGMQDNGEHKNDVWLPLVDKPGFAGAFSPEAAWEYAAESALEISKAYSDAGFHKQIFNRLTEAYQMMKTIITATEYGNFFWLRNDEAADPTLQELARLMQEAYDESEPQTLEPGQWHLPYVDFFQEVKGECEDGSTSLGDITYYIGDHITGENFEALALEDAIKVSCARCAAVSFRKVDYDVEKSRIVYDKLVGSDRKHASAFEHCGTPMAKESIDYDPGIGFDPDSDRSINVVDCPATWEEGITHVDRNYNLWSGNLKGFIQYRKLIPGENYEG